MEGAGVVMEVPRYPAERTEVVLHDVCVCFMGTLQKISALKSHGNQI